MEGDEVERRYLTGEIDISIHTLRMEGDGTGDNGNNKKQTFQSTPSAWRVTDKAAIPRRQTGFQSTPSAWRVTRVTRLTKSMWQISIHTLRMEGDIPIEQLCAVGHAFQSTPSAWRVTAASARTGRAPP